MLSGLLLLLFLLDRFRGRPHPFSFAFCSLRGRPSHLPYQSKFRLTVNHFDGSFMAGCGAKSAAVSFFFIFIDYLSNLCYSFFPII